MKLIIGQASHSFRHGAVAETLVRSCQVVDGHHVLDYSPCRIMSLAGRGLVGF